MHFVDFKNVFFQAVIRLLFIVEDISFSWILFEKDFFLQVIFDISTPIRENDHYSFFDHCGGKSITDSILHKVTKFIEAGSWQILYKSLLFSFFKKVLSCVMYISKCE